MRTFYRVIFWLVLSKVENVRSVNVKEAKSNEIVHQQRTRATANSYVVNHVFCESSLTEEEMMSKQTLEEVHTYAELKHDSRASLPDSFTICSTIVTTSCQNYAYPAFFTILDNNGTQLLTPLRSYSSINSIFIILFSQGSSEMEKGKIPPLFPNQWTRSCMAINTTTGSIHWVVEGALIMATISEEVKNSKSRPKDLSKKLVLGARSYGGVWAAPSSKVTNLNIFSSALSIKDMKRITGGESCLVEGDYLAWGDMEWILHGQARIETVDQEEPCKGDPYVNLYYTPFPGMDACMHHCENLGTRAPSVTDFQSWTTLQNYLKAELYDRQLNTLRLWLPVEDKKIEDVWNDFYSGDVLQNYTPPWVGSKPNGGIVQNCAFLLDGNTWGDINCDSPDYACMCTHNSSDYLQLKGLCASSSIDAHYKLISDITDKRKLKLQGLKQTVITFDKEEDIWTLNVTDSNLRGVSRASHASFTLGKHNWTIEGDKGCNGGKAYVTELKMSGCQKGSFTCNDGQCVSMDLRCNQLPDCRDESDERNCNILVLKDGYNKNVPPINSSDPVNVSISIDLLRLVDIDEEDYSIEIQFEIMMKWKENRARFHNLKHTAALNALTHGDIQKLWLPEVIYENTDQKESTRIGEFGAGEWKTNIVVTREEEDGFMSGPDFVDETEVFSGSHNSLVMNQSYTHTFQCNYQLAHYPFDTQVDSYSSSSHYFISFRLAL